jgi:membrane-bound acyltransferase YfiQ involved in biofilm formation
VKNVERIRNHPMAALSVLALGVFMTLLDLTIAHYVFTHAFVDAMHPTLVLPIVILLAAAFAAAFARAHKAVTIAVHEQEAAVA